MIRILTILFVVAGTTLGWYAPSLKVRFGITLGIGTEAFIELPQNINLATASGWIQKNRPNGPAGLSSLELRCLKNDNTVCILFDDTGYIAGLQIAFDKELTSNAVYDWTVQGFTNWTTTLGDNNTTKNYFTTQQYYVSAETLTRDPASRIAARNSSLLLQEGKLWVSGINGDLFEISTNASNITGAASIFTEQQCIPGMGTHYYYNMTPSTECVVEAMFPWFPLIDHDLFIGIGFNVFAQYEIKSGSTDWFEYSDETFLRYTVPYGPECLYEVSRRVGQVTLHTYFIENPYSVTCIS